VIMKSETYEKLYALKLEVLALRKVNTTATALAKALEKRTAAANNRKAKAAAKADKAAEPQKKRLKRGAK